MLSRAVLTLWTKTSTIYSFTLLFKTVALLQVWRQILCRFALHILHLCSLLLPHPPRNISLTPFESPTSPIINLNSRVCGDSDCMVALPHLAHPPNVSSLFISPCSFFLSPLSTISSTTSLFTAGSKWGRKISRSILITLTRLQFLRESLSLLRFPPYLISCFMIVKWLPYSLMEVEIGNVQ